MEHTQIGVCCLPMRKNIGIVFLDSLQCSRVDTLEFRHWLWAAVEPHSSTCKRCVPGPVKAWRAFTCKLFLKIGLETGKYGSKELHPLDLVLWFFPVPCTELTERKEKETHFGFSHLKSIVTPQPFIVLLFTIFKCPIVSGWFTLYK